MSSSASATASSGGISALGLVGVIFVTLKLLGMTVVAGWSWLWVLAPFWIPALIVLVVLGGILGLAIAAS